MIYKFWTSDEGEAKVMMQAKDMFFCLLDWEQELRGKLKYSSCSDETYAVLEDLSSGFWEIVEGRHVDLEAME